MPAITGNNNDELLLDFIHVVVFAFQSFCQVRCFNCSTKLLIAQTALSLFQQAFKGVP